MAITQSDTANQRDQVASLAPSTSDERSPLVEARMALVLYSLWIVLVSISVSTGQTVLAGEAVVVLAIGMVATNALFLLVAGSSTLHRPPAVTITLAQCILAITWTTLYAFMSAGPDMLILGMYSTALLFVFSRVRHTAFMHLAAFATISFAMIVTVKGLLVGPQQLTIDQFVSVLVLAGVMGWLVYCARNLQILAGDTTSQSSDSAAVKDVADRTPSAGHQRLIDELSREKGRTDRSNNPFSICLMEIDRFSSIRSSQGEAVVDLVLSTIGKRARGELRAMDGLNTGGKTHSVSQLRAGQYVVILPQTNLAGAARCAERIRSAVERFPVDGRYATTVSGGAVEYRRGEPVEALLERGEMALADARIAGGNQIAGAGSTDTRNADVIPIRKLTTRRH